jgi:hypothetical protein
METPSQIRYEEFLNTEYGVIGRTASTKSEPNTSSEFLFWISKKKEGVDLEIGNIVAAFTDGRDDITFGNVTEMRAYSDVESFISDYLSHDFGNASIDIPTDISEVIVVTCAVMRNLSGISKPVERSRVYFPSSVGIQFSYGIINERGESIYSGAAIPVGIFENGDGTSAPISVDEDFLIGPEGAHLNVSGISGLAAKTSAIEFTIKSLLTHTHKRIAVVMFNVKSKDLLYVDQLNYRLLRENDLFDEWSLNAYHTIDVPIQAFTTARYFAPTDPHNHNRGNSLRRLPVERFEWDLQMIYRDIPTLFNPFDWDDKMEGVWFVIQEQIELNIILTYTQMLQWIQREIDNANQARPPVQWIRGNHVATWNKMRSHLNRFPRSYPGLIATAGQGMNIPWREL